MRDGLGAFGHTAIAGIERKEAGIRPAHRAQHKGASGDLGRQVGLQAWHGYIKGHGLLRNSTWGGFGGLTQKRKGPAFQPIPRLQSVCNGSAYSAASATGRTEIKVRPFMPFLNVTRPSTTAKIV